MIVTWCKGLLRNRIGRLAGAIAGVAITVALLATIGSFISSGSAQMTRRAVKEVPVDWQVQVSHASDAEMVKSKLAKITTPVAEEQVGYASVDGLIAQTGGTTQITGSGQVLGISPAYAKNFPAEFRYLVGSKHGVLVAQQTAANLHVSPGDSVIIKRIGLPPYTVKVDGVIDLPNADSLFQAVGLPANAAPQAPPDNVLVLPAQLWHSIFDKQAAIRPDSVHWQIHTKLPHDLPSDPGAAHQYVQQLANGLEARIVGKGVVGNNLAARLGSVQEDAAYARVLFLFLGLPGAILAIMLTITIAAAGSTRRSKEQALLRVRGASVKTILQLEMTEAIIVGLLGVVLGIAVSFLVDRGLFNGCAYLSRNLLLWIVIAAVIGFAVAIAATFFPAWRQLRQTTVMSARLTVPPAAKPIWQRLYIDFALLLVSGLVFARAASTGYQVVLAPEGITTTSIHYEVFIAPLFLWLGAVLLAKRLVVDGVLGQGKKAIMRLLSPFTHGLAGVITASINRQRHVIGSGILFVALAISFAVSTSVFNTTYNAQSRVDAQLTNGADVTVTGGNGSAPGKLIDRLSLLPGVVAIQGMQHRYAYVGNDLQDIYGIDPSSISKVTNISNAFFTGSTAQKALAALAQQPDGVLVAAETVKDFQLKSGDTINLRLLNVRDHQYHVVPFHFIGIVREFPTAPSDSFLVANANYIAQQTGNSAKETVLIKTNGDPVHLAAMIRPLVSNMAGVKVSDINSTQNKIGSSLTAVNLRGLTGLELIFAILLVLGSTGLIFGLRLAERKRTFAILRALGAREHQLGSFIWSEGLLILSLGSVIGVTLGFAVAQMLVKVLTGVFDPPPEVLCVPWGYILYLLAGAMISTIIVVIIAIRSNRTIQVQSIKAL